MRDAIQNGETKIPILGDIPVLGFLFKQTQKTKTKSNLLLVLTPYVIRSPEDLRAIFERKMQERQEFIDRYFVFNEGATWSPPKDYRRANGLVEDIRQSMMAQEEKIRIGGRRREAEAKGARARYAHRAAAARRSRLVRRGERRARRHPGPRRAAGPQGQALRWTGGRRDPARHRAQGVIIMAEAHEYLGEVLVRRGVVPADRLPPLFDTVKERGQALTDLLVAANITDEAHIAQALADECGVSYMAKVDPDAVPLALVSRLPITYAKQHKILPIAEDDDTIYVRDRRPLRHRGARRRPRRVRQARRVRRGQQRGGAQRHQPRVGEEGARRDQARGRSGERGGQPHRHHRLGRRCADHRLGQRASSPRRSASERAISTSSPRSATWSSATASTASSTWPSARRSSSWRRSSPA